MANDTQEVEEIDAHAAVDLVAEGAVLLDVRELDEWEAGRAPVARHIPLGELESRHTELPLDRTIVCVCRSGGRSAYAAAALGAAGYDVRNLTGGMRAWRDADLPVINDSGDGDVI